MSFSKIVAFLGMTCFSALAAAQHTDSRSDPKGAEPADTHSTSGMQSVPYTLGICAVSGEKLGSMGDPIVRVYDGREVRLCCSGCIDTFEADLDASWKKVDAVMIKDQSRYYPMNVCVVTKDPLIDGADDIAVNMVYEGRLVRLCCKMCMKSIAADPEAFVRELDRAAAEAQRPEYPLDTCVVSGGELGSMGDPADLVLAGRLVRLCCDGCSGKLKAEPGRFLQSIDKAWQNIGKYAPMTPGTGGDD